MNPSPQIMNPSPQIMNAQLDNLNTTPGSGWTGAETIFFCADSDRGVVSEEFCAGSRAQISTYACVKDRAPKSVLTLVRRTTRPNMYSRSCEDTRTHVDTIMSAHVGASSWAKARDANADRRDEKA
eukprot:456297-Rhodomonas_salina.1